MSHLDSDSSSSSSSSSSDSSSDDECYTKDTSSISSNNSNSNRCNSNNKHSYDIDPSTLDAEQLELYNRLQNTLPTQICQNAKRTGIITRRPRHTRSKTEFIYHSNSSNINNNSLSPIDNKYINDNDDNNDNEYNIHVSTPTDTEYSTDSTSYHTRNSSSDSNELNHYIDSQQQQQQHTPINHKYSEGDIHTTTSQPTISTSYHNTILNDSDYSDATTNSCTTPDLSPQPTPSKHSQTVGRFEVSDDNATPQLNATKTTTQQHNDVPDLTLHHSPTHTKLDSIEEANNENDISNNTEVAHDSGNDSDADTDTYSFVVPELPVLYEGETSNELIMRVTRLPDISVSITPTGKGLEFNPCTMKFKHDSGVLECKFRVTATQDCKPGDICVKYVVCGSSAEDYAVPKRDVLHLKCNDTAHHNHNNDNDNNNNNNQSTSQPTSTYNHTYIQPTHKRIESEPLSSTTQQYNNHNNNITSFATHAMPRQSGRFTIVDEIDTSNEQSQQQCDNNTQPNTNINNSSLYLAAQATTNVALALADHVNKVYGNDEQTIYATSNSCISLPNGTAASIQAQVSKTMTQLTPRQLNTGGSPASSNNKQQLFSSQQQQHNDNNSNNDNNIRNNNNNTIQSHSVNCSCNDCNIQHINNVQRSTSATSSTSSNSNTMTNEFFSMLDPIQMVAMLQDKFASIMQHNQSLIAENNILKDELQQLRLFKQQHSSCLMQSQQTSTVANNNNIHAKPDLNRSATVPIVTSTGDNNTNNNHSSSSSSINQPSNLTTSNSTPSTKSTTFYTNILPYTNGNNKNNNSQISNSNNSKTSSNGSSSTSQTTTNSTKPLGISNNAVKTMPSPVKSNKQREPSSRTTNSTYNTAIFHTLSPTNSVTIQSTTTQLQLNNKQINNISSNTNNTAKKPLTSTTTTTTTTIPLGQINDNNANDLLEQLSNKCITSLTATCNKTNHNHNISASVAQHQQVHHSMSNKSLNMLDKDESSNNTTTTTHNTYDIPTVHQQQNSVGT